MEYGLWNLHGGFWTGNNPCAGNDRTLYNSVNASGGNVFHGCPETVSFSNMTATPPCRSAYRGQPEYVAMKPAVVPVRSSTDSVMPPRAPSVSENVEVMPSLQNEILTDHNSQDQGSINPNMMPMSLAQPNNSLAPVIMPESSTNHSTKKVKMPKSSRKKIESMKSGNVLPPVSLPYLNQQYNNPMYSMVFNRPSMKRSDNTSDESDDEDDEDENANEADNYSNGSSTNGNQSPSRSGMSRPGFECGQCDLVADTRPALKKHISICHPAPQPDSNMSHTLKLPGSCPMPSCHFRSLSSEELEGHIGRHVADGYQRQPSLSKKRNNAISLQRVRYEREEYRCQMCSYTCTIEKAFYKHLKLHSMGMNVPAVKISCVICGKDRPSEVEMNKHMRKHRDNRYFCCDICIFRTVQLKKLIQHRRMHTGEKPHLCPHCAYRSARRDNLRSHVRRVHKKDNLFCDTFSPRGLLASPSSPGRQH